MVWLLVWCCECDVVTEKKLGYRVHCGKPSYIARLPSRDARKASHFTRFCHIRVRFCGLCYYSYNTSFEVQAMLGRY